MLALNRELLEAVWRRYGVPPRVAVALWGMESDFGRRTGQYPVTDALATLAHDGHRGPDYGYELFHVLRTLDDGHISAKAMSGSWAGAMGQNQLMPSRLTAYAVDHDGDRRRDIWANMADMFASTANHLAKIGGHRANIWGSRPTCPVASTPCSRASKSRSL